MAFHLADVMQEARRRCTELEDCPLALAVDDLAMPVPDTLMWTKAVIARDAITLSLCCNPADCCVRPFLEQVRDAATPGGAEG